VVGSVDLLEALGLIEHQRARPGDWGWQSAMNATPSLIQRVQEATGGQLLLAPLREPILLRDADRNLLDYRDTRLTEKMRREVQAQNEAIMGTSYGQTLPFPGRLRRIFNGDFGRGGRAYAEGGSWQTLSKAERSEITIGGEPAIEIDYSTFHPTLAYAEQELGPPIAPYDVPGFPRDLVKIAFNVLLNSSSRHGARYTVAHKAEMAEHLGVGQGEENLQSLRDHLATTDPGYFHRANQRAEHLIEAILAKHDSIRLMFFTGAGARLQRRDSDIAEAVMRRMRNLGIVVLPVHDSFLTPASQADLLEQVMVEEAARHGAIVACKRSSNVSGS
jgi:hypothetical protein